MKHLLPLILGGTLASSSLHAQSLTWTQRTTGVAAGLQYTSAAYGAGKYAVVAYGNGATLGTFQSQVAISADTVAWSVTTLPSNPVARGITYGGGLWIIPAERNGADSGNTQNILTSSDGVTWTLRTTGVGSLWKVAHTSVGSGNLYVATGLASAGPNAVYSTDAITWIRVAVGSATAVLAQLAAGNGVVVTAGGTGGTVYTTANGSAWTTVTLPGQGASNAVVGLTYAGGEFIAGVRTSSGATQIFTSPTGAVWTAGPVSSGAPAEFNANGLGASGAATSGSSRLIIAGGSFNINTLTGVSSILTATGALTTWTSQQFGSGDFASHNFAFFANNLWLVGNNSTQLFSAPDTAGGGSSGGGGGGTPAPTVATHPAAQSAAPGGNATFTAAGAGTGLTYQWLFNNSPIAGATGATYTIAAVTAANAGSYSVTIANTGGSVTSNPATLTVTPASAGIAFLSNLSVRARAGSGNETLIVGVTVGGSASASAKSVLVRGIGPTLAAFGVTGFLPDPVLTVLSGTTPIATNDDWGSDASVAATSAAVGAFALPAGSRDSALFGSGLGSGGYTVQLTGKAGATGNGLVELYDTAAATSVTATTTRFTNLSARTFGGTGADTLIVGFNVAGSGSRRLVIRAVGPGLAAFGVTGTMADPKLELYQGQTKVGENDNWEGSTLAAQQSVGAFALTANSRDAVLVSTLPPGSYTVQVAGGTTGVTLVEVYEAP